MSEWHIRPVSGRNTSCRGRRWPIRQVSDHTMLSMAQDMQQGRIHEMSWQFVCWILLAVTAKAQQAGVTPDKVLAVGKAFSEPQRNYSI